MGGSVDQHQQLTPLAGAHRSPSPAGWSPKAQQDLHPADSANVSSQKFKDELAVKQARLSPNPDAKLSIDERIRLNKENQSLNSDPACRANNRLPDKLNNSSSLQRDKRPFAYSPDVNDPNNRGKIDLSQIKSPMMRRRLIANMQDSEDQANEAELQKGCVPEGCHSQELDEGGAKVASPVVREHVPIRLLDADLQQQQPIYHQPQQAATLNQQQQQQAGHPVLSANPNGDRQAPPMSRPIIRYNSPPKFYQLQQQAARSSGLDYLESLNDEIAESLESLSLLANNLDTSPRHYSPSGQPELATHHHDLGPSATQPTEPQRALSTFLPPKTQDYGRATTDMTHPHHRAQTQSFHSGPSDSGSAHDGFCSPGNSSSNYFGASLSSSGPYSMSPFYGSPLDVDEPAQPSRERFDNTAATYRTFGARWPAAPASNSTTQHQLYEPAHHNCAPLTATSSGVATSCHNNQVRALREMSARLEGEVDRLYNLDVKLANR